MSLSVQLSAAWAIVLLGLFVVFARRGTSISVTRVRPALLLILGVAAITRLVPNLVLPMGAGYDIESYRIVGDLVRQGNEVYGDPTTLKRHPYLPFLMYWMAAARSLEAWSHVPFVQIVRLAPIAGDIAIALVLFRVVRRRTGSVRSGFYTGMVYALNPISVFVAAYHGQLDSLPTLGALLAIIWTPALPFVAGAALGFGILCKSWPVLILPALWSSMSAFRDRVKLLIGTALLPLAGVALYLWLFNGSLTTVLARALGYNWGVGVWGYTYLVRLFDLYVLGDQAIFLWFVANARYLTLAILAAIWFFKARHETAAQAALTILVGFLAVTHAFSIQYLMWLVPVALVVGEYRWLTRYTIAAFVYMLLAYTTLILEMHVTRLLPMPLADYFIIIPASLPVWIVTVAWLADRLRQPIQQPAGRGSAQYGLATHAATNLSHE